MELLDQADLSEDMEYCWGHVADNEGLSDLANGIYPRILPAHPMDNYDITIQSQLIDEKEGYQTDYPYWRLRIIHWLMGLFFFNPFIPSTIKLKYMALFVVTVQSQWLFNVQ